MGAGLSSSLCLDTKTDKTGPFLGPGLDDVPESCVSYILMHLDPPEICRLAGLNRAFHGASSADFLWESKLPRNYRFLVERVLLRETTPEAVLNKKDTYASLCRPNFFDGGTKLAWLDKNSGKLCVSISYKALRITGIDDRRYWSHISSQQSRFKAIAYLHQTWWLEVMGELEFQFPPGNYSLFFRLQLGKPKGSSSSSLNRRSNCTQVHGWDIKPVRFQLSASNGQQSLMSQCYLQQDSGNWVHYHVGDIVVDDNLGSNALTKIKFSMMQIDCTHTKGGLSLDSVLICPSEFRECFIKS